jgi:pimeloyl-ACP methyl ester carboxylesterase
MNEWPTPSEHGFFPAKDGTRLYWETHGEGPPLVLCYGLSCRKEHWRHQLPYFRKRFRVVFLDYRGHNASEVPSSDRALTLGHCAEDLRSLLDALGIQRAAFAGHSLGVAVLVEAASRFPERFHAMALICGAVHNPFDHMLYTDRLNTLYRLSALFTAHFPGASEAVWRLASPKNPVARYLALQLGFNPERAARQDVESYLEGVRRMPTTVFHALLADYTATDRRTLLTTLAVPTLVVAGENDCVTPLEVQQEMARLIPGGRLLTVPGGSHNAHCDFPETVNQALEAFFEESEALR